MDLNKPREEKIVGNKDLRLKYEPPKITTYTEEEIIEQIGPAQACSPSPCPVGP